mmetsp:Transcript_52504/g.122870  ORF Transcript_52504/g.122870 Transcript_52504/m.122870 type:complete len:444 (+) Transcript_52504:58-1389(+)
MQNGRAGLAILCTWLSVWIGQAQEIEQLRLTPLGTEGVRVTFVVLGAPPNGAASVSVAAAGTFAATARTYHDEGGWSGTIYSANLVKVPACFDYTASVGSIAAEPVHACLAPAKYPLRIAAVADIGAPSVRGSPGVSNSTINYLNVVAQRGEVDAGMVAGDIAYIDRSTCSDTDREDDEVNYDEFFRAMEPFFARVPTLTAVGNHEVPGSPRFVGYSTRLAADMPNAGPGSDGMWHVSTIGKVAFLTLSSEHDYSVGSPQHQWAVQVVGDLAKQKQAGTIDWIIAQMHRTFYTSTDDYYDRVISAAHLRASFEMLFRTGSQDGSGWPGNYVVVDLLVGGHLHNTEQFLPAFNGSTVSRDYHNPTATVQLVVGNAGDQEGLTRAFSSPWDFSTVRIAELGYGNITAHNQSVLEVSSVLVPNATSTATRSHSFYITRTAPTVVLT